MRYLWMSVAAFFLDLGIKEEIEQSMKESEKRSYFKGRIQIERYHNYGGVCNVLEKKPGLMRRIHTLILICTGAYTANLLKKRGIIGNRIGTAFLLAGGLNNLWDRYKRGYVVDYLRFSTPWKRLNQMIFNLSDFGIFLGAVLITLSSKKQKS